MNLSAQQTSALDAIHSWIRDKDAPCFYLAGAAGTGKTTLAQYVAEGQNTAFLSFTGKAASVLRSKGCEGATTVHSQIYTVKERDKTELQRLEAEYDKTGDERLLLKLKKARKEAQSPSFTLNPNSAIRDCDLIILDECSMIDEFMGNDLLSFGVPILVLGDRHQLPPVKGTGFFTNQTPDFELTEIHRQALDSGIIQFATDIRKGRPVYVDGYYGPDVKIVTQEEFVEQIRPYIVPPTQVLVGINKTRNKANRLLRDQMGFYNKYPMERDRVICLRNNHDKGLLNGAQFTVLEGAEASAYDDYMRMTIRSDEGEEFRVKFHREVFHLDEKGRNEEPDWRYAKEAEWFDFACAVTVHKFQGSEADDVVVIDESRRFYDKGRKHRYTAATRAAKHLTWVVG